MNVRRGDVVLADFPFPSGIGSKGRPAVVIQNDRDNGRLLNTILVQITSTTHRALEPTQVLLERNSVAGQQAGLLIDSVVNCVNVVTVDKKRFLRRLGYLPVDAMREVEQAVKVALQLP